MHLAKRLACVPIASLSFCPISSILLDKEAPEVTSCPKDQTHELLGASSMKVRWDKPSFKDNSGIPPAITSSVKMGATLDVGEHIVNYFATDVAGNVNSSCQFKIHIKGKSFKDSTTGRPSSVFPSGALLGAFSLIFFFFFSNCDKTRLYLRTGH